MEFILWMGNVTQPLHMGSGESNKEILIKSYEHLNIEILKLK